MDWTLDYIYGLDFNVNSDMELLLSTAIGVIVTTSILCASLLPQKFTKFLPTIGHALYGHYAFEHCSKNHLLCF